MRMIGCMIVAVLAAALIVFANRRFRSTDIEPERDVVVTVRTDDSIGLVQRPDARQEEVYARLLEKDRTAKALLRGEVTLDQAAERFRELTCDDEKAVQLLQQWFRATGDEVYYRNVIKFARGTAYGQPKEIHTVLALLEDELRRRFPPPVGFEEARP